MVAPLIAAAGISAASSLIGGIMGGKGAKAAAKTQQQTTQMQIAANQANMARIQGLSQPAIDNGNWAGDIYSGLLGKGDPAASSAALATYRGSTGYQDLLKTGLGAVNANAYARGMPRQRRQPFPTRPHRNPRRRRQKPSKLFAPGMGLRLNSMKSSALVLPPA